MPRFSALTFLPFLLCAALTACKPMANAYENLYQEGIRPELEKANSPFLPPDHRRAAVTRSVYCYRTLGQPMCYHQKHAGQEERLLGYFEVEYLPDGAVVADAPAPEPGPVEVKDTKPVLVPQTAERPKAEPTPVK